MTAVPGPGYDPKGVGDMSMSQVMASLLKCGMRLLLPFGDNQRYDLAVDEDGRLVRVQCKTAQFCGDKFTFSPNSVNWNTRQRRDYRGQADVFAVYVRELDRTFIVNVDRCPVRSCTIRLTACHLKSARTAEAHEMRPGRSLLDYP